MVKKIKQVTLTIPQADAVRSTQKMKFLEWARGSGKSTILGFFARQFVVQMPRATFFLVGSTFSQVLSRTFPSTKEGLELFNIYEGVDYVVGTSGQKYGFEMPYQQPNQWQNVVHFSNGAIFALISQDNPNSGRGFNTFGGMGDEAAILDQEKLFNNAQTTNRAQRDHFMKCSMLGAEVYASSTPITKKGKWFTDMEKKAITEPNEYFFSKAPATTNHTLRADYFKKMRDNSVSQTIYEAEILNIRPKEITDGFYALLTPKHYYTDYDNNYLEGQIWVKKEGFGKFDCRQDNDLDKKAPLIVTLDFGVFNSLVVMQEHRVRGEIRVLKSMFAKSPKLLDDLFTDDFIPYYAPHQDKKIYLYGGHDGHNRSANSSRTLYEQIEELLRAHGWTVYVKAKPSAPAQTRKYYLINAMLKENNPKLPRIRINQSNCEDLIISLERTEAIEGEHGPQKDKRHERNKSMLQQHTTHLSDAFDAPLYDKYWDTYDTGSTQSFGGIILLG